MFRILFVGDSGVGKSTLMQRVADGTFTPDCTPSVGVDFRQRSLEVDGQIVPLTLWDTPGAERYKSMIVPFYRAVDVIVLTYEITNAQSLDNLSERLADVDRLAPPSAVKLLLGNKADQEMQRQVSRRDGQSFANALGFVFAETSAATALNVNEPLILALREAAIRRRSKWSRTFKALVAGVLLLLALTLLAMRDAFS